MGYLVSHKINPKLQEEKRDYKTNSNRVPEFEDKNCGCLEKH